MLRQSPWRSTSWAPLQVSGSTLVDSAWWFPIPLYCTESLRVKHISEGKQINRLQYAPPSAVGWGNTKSTQRCFKSVHSWLNKSKIIFAPLPPLFSVLYVKKFFTRKMDVGYHENASWLCTKIRWRNIFAIWNGWYSPRLCSPQTAMLSSQYIFDTLFVPRCSSIKICRLRVCVRESASI